MENHGGTWLSPPARRSAPTGAAPTRPCQSHHHLYLPRPYRYARRYGRRRRRGAARPGPERAVAMTRPRRGRRVSFDPGRRCRVDRARRFRHWTALHDHRTKRRRRAHRLYPAQASAARAGGRPRAAPARRIGRFLDGAIDRQGLCRHPSTVFRLPRADPRPHRRTGGSSEPITSTDSRPGWRPRACRGRTFSPCWSRWSPRYAGSRPGPTSRSQPISETGCAISARSRSKDPIRATPIAPSSPASFATPPAPMSNGSSAASGSRVPMKATPHSHRAAKAVEAVISERGRIGHEHPALKSLYFIRMRRGLPVSAPDRGSARPRTICWRAICRRFLYCSRSRPGWRSSAARR